MGRGSYDTMGATVGAAGHDAAVLTEAIIVASGDPVEPAEVFAMWQLVRDLILADSLAVQARIAVNDVDPDAPQGADYVLPWGKHKGKSLAEIHAIPGDESSGDGASYLTWVVANSDDKGAVAQVRSFLASRQA